MKCNVSMPVLYPGMLQPSDVGIEVLTKAFRKMGHIVFHLILLCEIGN